METPLHPEILAPVGDLKMAYAAVHAGADAIYVGAPGANARARAAPLTDSEFEELLTLCRLYGVKSYLALNTLLFEEEIPQLIFKCSVGPKNCQTWCYGRSIWRRDFNIR